MTLEAGIVCGQCDRLNPLQTSACEDCGFELSLQSAAKARISIVAEAETEQPGSQAEDTPLRAIQKGDEEKPMEQARHYICKSCYSPVPSGHKFCGKCGTPSETANVEQEPNYFGDMQAPGKAKLILIRGEGMDGISYHLNSIEHVAGRMEGAILFTEDKWLSPKHANFYYDDTQLMVRDEGSENGVFICVKGRASIETGAVVMAGEQFFKVEQVPPHDDSPNDDGTYYFSSPRKDASFRLIQILEGGGDGMVVHSREDRVIVGRENCDMNFPNDPYISGTHFKVEFANGALQMEDLESKNGTYVKIAEKQQLAHGDYIFLGRQLLRVEITE